MFFGPDCCSKPPSRSLFKHPKIGFEKRNHDWVHLLKAELYDEGQSCCDAYGFLCDWDDDKVGPSEDYWDRPITWTKWLMWREKFDRYPPGSDDQINKAHMRCMPGASGHKCCADWSSDGVIYYGDDLPGYPKKVASMLECRGLCEKTIRCKSITWKPAAGKCHLKHSIAGAFIQEDKIGYCSWTKLPCTRQADLEKVFPCPKKVALECRRFSPDTPPCPSASRSRENPADHVEIRCIAGVTPQQSHRFSPGSFEMIHHMYHHNVLSYTLQSCS